MKEHTRLKARNDHICELVQEGKTHKQVADVLGICVGTVDYVCKNRGLTSLVLYGERICEQCGNTFEAKATNQKYCSVKCIRKAERERETKTPDDSAIIKQIAEKHPGFEYAGNYTGSNGTADLRCKTCGHVVTRACVTIRHQKVKCDACADAERERKRIAQEQEKERKETDRAEARYNRKIKRIKANILRIATEKHLCKMCGASMRGWNKFCSELCASRYHNSKGWTLRRARIKDALIDRDITLKEVYETDGGICYLCGGQCDWNDCRRDGTQFIVGGSYPSIDHVVPLTKGGEHSWSNVRLAHLSCNAKKGNRHTSPCAV